MAVVLKRALCLLPLLFHLGFTQSLFFDKIFKEVSNGFSIEGNNNEAQGTDPNTTNGGEGGTLRDGKRPEDQGTNPNTANGGGGSALREGKRPAFVTQYKGGWKIVSENAGISAMHVNVLPNNKAIMFDATVFGPSEVKLANEDCRSVPGANPRMAKMQKAEMDCWAHSVEYDIDTAVIRSLKVLTDTWCSSGGLNPNGTLVNTGGWKDGGKAIRYISGCETCDWKEYPTALSGQRWYSTQQILPDGGFIVIGGRRMFNYEYVPKEGKSNLKSFNLPFLRQTTDISENNLYPFVHLSTDGNLFVFANNRSILLDPRTNKIVRELPALAGGSRNYPGSGMSVLLPIKLYNQNPQVIHAEVLVCGGAKPEAARLSENNTFLAALQDCARLQITNPEDQWKKEIMPSPRVMGDMLILPNGDILMINGAKKGVSGWQFADDPNLTPVLYNPRTTYIQRFTELAPTTIPRMYHSTSAVLPDGTILVAGSNTNSHYNYTGVKFPTELRVEKFSPPYLDPQLGFHRPLIMEDLEGMTMKYGQNLELQFKVRSLGLDESDLLVTMYAPPFTTHGYSMNQRLLVLGVSELVKIGLGMYRIAAVAPPSGAVAPPGYYLIFVVHRGLPSPGVWAHIE